MICDKGEINDKIIQALVENKKARIEKIEQEMDQLENAETLFEIDPKTEKKILKLIKNHNKSYYKYINSAAKKAAIFIAVLLVVFTTSLITVESFRTEFTEFIVQTYEKFSLIFLADSDDENTLTVIEEYYAPTWVPDGFEIVEEVQEPDFYYISYENNQNNKISFIQKIEDLSGVDINNEGFVLEELYIDDLHILFSSNYENSTTSVIFNYDYFTFVINVDNVSNEDLILIVKSVIY